jgi:hypothetical protein
MGRYTHVMRALSVVCLFGAAFGSLLAFTTYEIVASGGLAVA